MTWQTWVMIFMWAVSKVALIFALCEPFSLKYKKSSVVLCHTMCMILLFAARAYFYIHCAPLPTDVMFFAIIIPVYSGMFMRIICRDKFAKIVLFSVLIYALGIISHIFAPILYQLIFGEPIVFDFVGIPSMYASFIANTIEVILYLAFLFFWKRYIGKIHSNIPNAGTFLLIIGGQLIYTMIQMFLEMSHLVEVNIWMLFGVIIMTIGDLAILQVLLTNSKKIELEENLREIQHIRELEHAHYTAIEARRQELTKIRHDFNIQLLAAYQLISADKERQAEQLLNELKASLASTKEYTYCNNAIVNAILMEKQKKCDQDKITLETDIEIDEACKITPLHLCSVFSNILDNAISACKHLPHEQRTIELRTAIKGDYLHIKCVNSVSDYPEKKRSGRGYGKIILSDIANHYHGNFSAERIDKTYVTLISLLAVTV